MIYAVVALAVAVVVLAGVVLMQSRHQAFLVRAAISKDGRELAALERAVNAVPAKREPERVPSLDEVSG